MVNVLEQRLADVVGAASAQALQRAFTIDTVGDLLGFFPRKYLDRGELSPISELPLDQDVTLVAHVVSSTSRSMRSRKGSITDVLVTDGLASGDGASLRISFFNGWRAARDLQPGMTAMFSGKVGEYRGALTLTNPEYSLLDPDGDADAQELAARPIPIYPATAKLPSWKTAAVVAAVLSVCDLSTLADPLPPEVRDRHRLMFIGDAYRSIHAPGTVVEGYSARHRFRFEEAFVLQTAMAQRKHLAQSEAAVPRPGVSSGILDAFDARLPFELTAGQRRVGAEISADLNASVPMQRLLQGEVGSGKTLVALRAMLQVVDSGGQAALLAPTEVLAAQHYASLTKTLGPLAAKGMFDGAEQATRLTLLTGSLSTAAKRRALLDAASGEAGIVIGTHALLADRVQFADLGLVVVDEQHRFGVEQRDALRAKSATSPHVLVMTATPIPRTVAMTVFGDLETSELSELPAGRAPISTHVVALAEHPSWEKRIWQRSREEIDAGHQVYVVCPRIGDSGEREDDLAVEASGGEAGAAELRSVESVLQQLQSEPALAGCRIEALHGRLDPEQKSRVMTAFAAGDIDVLVSTTVIEVGVDVPNATLMVLLDADRFGISQLHQLRGRVGRGGLPGTALLVTSLDPGNPSRERLDAVANSTDGFELARVDVQLRREGDILGASQSGGRSTLRLLRVIRDEKLIEQARAEASALVSADPGLEDHQVLAGTIARVLNTDQAAFLDRG